MVRKGQGGSESCQEGTCRPLQSARKLCFTPSRRKRRARKSQGEKDNENVALFRDQADRANAMIEKKSPKYLRKKKILKIRKSKEDRGDSCVETVLTRKDGERGSTIKFQL